jgi:hypothetical protein
VLASDLLRRSRNCDQSFWLFDEMLPDGAVTKFNHSGARRYRKAAMTIAHWSGAEKSALLKYWYLKCSSNVWPLPTMFLTIFIP